VVFTARAAVALAALTVVTLTRKRRVECQLYWCDKDERMKRVLKRAEKTMGPGLAYSPAWWLSYGWMNLGWFMVKSKLLSRGARLQRQEMTAPDGALLSIDWTDDDATRALPADAPIMIVLHTVTGSGRESWHFTREMGRMGWRSCVFNRVGNGMPLKTPRFNVMGEVDDTKLQVAAVQAKYPNAFLAMAGLSAGSGHLVNYLGKESVRSPVGAGLSLCPAYDIEKAFVSLADRFPVVNRVIVRAMKAAWLEGNEDVLKQRDPEALKACQNAKTMFEIFGAATPFSGFKDFSSYCEVNNPMNFYMNIACPTLLLNALDDPVCLPENIPMELAPTTPNCSLLVTKTGSHIAYSDGGFGQGQWMARLAVAFADAARAEAGAK